MDNEDFKNNPKTKYLALQYTELIKSDPESAKYIWQQMVEIVGGVNDGGSNSAGSAGSDEIILEIRAGAGGDEAALFARDLGNMYSAYARKMGWKITELDNLGYEIKGPSTKPGAGK